MKNSPVSFLIITLIVCNMCAASAQKTAKIYKEYLQNPQKSILTDFSYAGYQYGEKEIPSLPIKVNVKDKGILPNTGADLTVSIQNLIDEVGKSGGGVIYFPKGKYCVNMDTTRIQFLKVDYDNVVLRGEGSTTDGTVIFNGSTTIQEKVNPWISPALIRFGYKIQPTEKFWGVAPLKPVIKFVKSASAADPGSDGSIFEAPVLTSITKNSPKGDKKLYVTSTKNIKAGDVIVVAMYNTTPDGNLIKDILNYSDQDITLDLVSVKAAGTEGMASFQHLLEVEAVQGSNVIVLKQPLRRDIQLIYKPVIAGAPMIREVGLENLRFESAWDGIYLHHGGGKYSPHLSKIMDYGWNAVNFCRVANGWMRNVSIDNYSNPVYLQDSRNVTIENLKTTGPTGHCGIKIYTHASDNLIRNISFESNFTHMLSAEGNAYGNVCTRITYNFKDSFPGDFDFHGFSLKTYSPPSWTLFELVKGFNRVNGGGARYDMPHTGRFNVWWNIESHGLKKPTELFEHWCWTSDGKKQDHFKMYPGSIVVGYHSDSNPLVVNGTQEDRNNPELYLEALNNGQVLPLSLYEAQLKKRLKK